MRQQFVSIELYDQGGKKLTEMRNPGYDAIGAELRKQYRQLPMDGRYHYEKVVINNEVFVQVLAPVKGSRPVALGFVASFFSNVYSVANYAEIAIVRRPTERCGV